MTLNKEVQYEARLTMLRTDSLYRIGLFPASVRDLSRGGHCTSPVSHDEAMHAAQLKKAWGDEALYVRPGR